MNDGRILGVVLAGGRSARMGRDKALLPFRGCTLVERAIALLRGVDCEPVIAGSRPDLAGFAPVLDDLHPACGPLSGIEAALVHAAASGHERVLCLPVDLPLLPQALLRLLLERSALTGAWVTLPTLGGRPQPLCSVFRPALLPSITAALASGMYKVMQPFERLAPGQRDQFSLEGVAAACRDLLFDGDPSCRWFENLNTPEALDQLDRLDRLDRLEQRERFGGAASSATLVAP